MNWACELGLTVEQGKKILDKNKEIFLEVHNKEGTDWDLIDVFPELKRKFQKMVERKQARAFREIAEQSQLLITTNLVKISNKKELKKLEEQ